MPTTGSSSSDSRPWLKPRDLAAREGIHRVTVWRWVEKGLLEARRRDVKTGVRVRLAEREQDA